MTLEKIIKETRKHYGHLADIQLENDKLVNRNRATGILHPFSDNRKVIPIPNSLKIKVNEWLK